MQTDDQTLQRTADLIAKATALFQFHPNDTFRMNPLPIRADQYTAWRTQCLTFLIDLLGESHNLHAGIHVERPSVGWSRAARVGKHWCQRTLRTQ